MKAAISTLLLRHIIKRLVAEAALKYYNSATYKKATYSYKTGISYNDYYDLYFAVRSASSKEEARKMTQSVVGNNASQVAAMLKLLGISLTDSEKSLTKTYFSKLLTDDELVDLSLKKTVKECFN